jgi:hypothetical protein
VDQYAGALRPDTALAALISASHEVGTVQPVEQVAERCAAAEVPLLVDAAQTVGRAPVPAGWSVLTASSRKWGGPPGVGLLVVRTGTRWRSPLPAEDAARGREPGGVPLPAALAAAVGLQAAAAEAAAEDARLRTLVDRLRTRVPELVEDVEVVGDPGRPAAAPDGLLLAVPRRRDPAAVPRPEGFSVSSGSSCSASRSSRATCCTPWDCCRTAACGCRCTGTRPRPTSSASWPCCPGSWRSSARLGRGGGRRDGRQVRRHLGGSGLPYTSAKRPTNCSGVKAYSCVPTVSTTWVATSAPTCAERSGDSPHPVAHRKPARKASPTPVGSTTSRAGAGATSSTGSPRRRTLMPSGPCVVIRVPTTSSTCSAVQPVFSCTRPAS